jgi:hypothetical protein
MVSWRGRMAGLSMEAQLRCKCLFSMIASPGLSSLSAMWVWDAVGPVCSDRSLISLRVFRTPATGLYLLPVPFPLTTRRRLHRIAQLCVNVDTCDDLTNPMKLFKHLRILRKILKQASDRLRFIKLWMGLLITEETWVKAPSLGKRSKGSTASTSSSRGSNSGKRRKTADASAHSYPTREEGTKSETPAQLQSQGGAASDERHRTSTGKRLARLTERRLRRLQKCCGSAKVRTEKWVESVR